MLTSNQRDVLAAVMTILSYEHIVDTKEVMGVFEEYRNEVERIVVDKCTQGRETSD